MDVSRFCKSEDTSESEKRDENIISNQRNGLTWDGIKEEELPCNRKFQRKMLYFQRNISFVIMALAGNLNKDVSF